MNTTDLTFGQALFLKKFSGLSWAEKDYLREFCIDDNYLLDILLDEEKPDTEMLANLEAILCVDVEGELFDLWQQTKHNSPRYRQEY